MKYYDVTLALDEKTIPYPEDPKFISENIRTVEDDGYNLKKIEMTTHTGTHIDAPYHFLEKGIGVDEIPIDSLIGEAKVFHIKGRCIDRKVLEGLNICRGDRVIFKTSNSDLWSRNDFCDEFVSLTEDGAEFLREREILMAGIDYLSIENFNNDKSLVHKILLESGIIILEGLDLREVDEGAYRIMALPLKIAKGDGSPARVILEKNIK